MYSSLVVVKMISGRQQVVTACKFSTEFLQRDAGQPNNDGYRGETKEIHLYICISNYLCLFSYLSMYITLFI